ncbi:MAG: hypothetical protein ABI947_19970 [Chloroflexota bacterium]
MVKKAEVERKRSPLYPVFALFLVVGMLAVAYAITELVVLKMPQVRAVVSNAVITQARVGFTLGIWFVLMAFAFFLVSILVGNDPNDVKAMPLPPKQKDLKKQKRR